MIRSLLIGLWVCILTAGASYGVAYWKENGSLLPQKDEYLDGLQYQKTRVLSVPMVENGSVQGYVVARFVLHSRCPDHAPAFCSSRAFCCG
jgi:hypothetical protein